MGKLIALLSVLLIVQVGVVAWVQRSADELTAFDATAPLVDLEASRVDELIIEGGEKERLVIKREEGQWLLPDHGNFPVAPSKLEGFLEKLLAAKPSWPVGTTQVAAQQLEVAEDAFERRIRLLGNGRVLNEVYLGSSPGFRKVHARLGGATNTHVIDFNTFDAPTDPADWRDRDLLRLPEAELERIDMGAFALARGPEGFEVVGLAEEEEKKPEEIAEVVRAVTTLSFLDELADEGKAAFEQGELILEFSLKGKNANPVEYTIVAPGEGDHYILKASNRPFYFKVAKKKFDELRAVDREQLVQVQPESVEGQTSNVQPAPSKGERKMSGVEGQRSKVEDQETAAGD